MVDKDNVAVGCSCCSDCGDTALNTQAVTLDCCSCGPGCCKEYRNPLQSESITIGKP